jgi:hypothetical protein
VIASRPPALGCFIRHERSFVPTYLPTYLPPRIFPIDQLLERHISWVRSHRQGERTACNILLGDRRTTSSGCEEGSKRAKHSVSLGPQFSPSDITPSGPSWRNRLVPSPSRSYLLPTCELKLPSTSKRTNSRPRVGSATRRSVRRTLPWQNGKVDKRKRLSSISKLAGEILGPGNTRCAVLVANTITFISFFELFLSHRDYPQVKADRAANPLWHDYMSFSQVGCISPRNI